MFYETYSKRIQMRYYDTNSTPEFSIVEDALHKSHNLVSSKQNLMPYQIYVINNNKEINKGLYELSKGNTGTLTGNTQLLTAPYQFIYTARLVTDANNKTKLDIGEGQLHQEMNPAEYRNIGQARATCIEVGMHSTILSTLLIEKGLAVAYTLCFNDWLYDRDAWISNGIDFIDDYVYFIMSAGYPTDKYLESKYIKPPYENIIRYV